MKPSPPDGLADLIAAATAEWKISRGVVINRRNRPTTTELSIIRAGDALVALITRLADRLSLTSDGGDGADPIPMILHCPACGLQHVDAPDEADINEISPREQRWDNPPHRSHLCHGCGHIWRPADVPTEGVAKIKTRGTADSPATPSTPGNGVDAELREAVARIISPEWFLPSPDFGHWPEVLAKRRAEARDKAATILALNHPANPDAELRAMSEALEPFASLEVPTKSAFNAGAYSIRFSAIERARRVKREIEEALARYDANLAINRLREQLREGEGEN